MDEDGYVVLNDQYPRPRRTGALKELPAGPLGHGRAEALSI